MIKILSWNIQNGKGVDGQISLARDYRCDPLYGVSGHHMLCEVSRGLPSGRPPAPRPGLELSRLLDGYEYVFGAAIDTRGGRSLAVW